MHPPPENGEGVTRDNADAPETLTTYAADTVINTQPACNSKIKSVASMPDGVGYFFDEEGKRQYEQCTVPPTEAVPLNERQEYARIVLGMSEWVHAPKLSLRWAAAFVALETLNREASDLASEFGVTPRRAQQLIAEARAVLAELRGEAAPSSGAP